MTKKAETHAGAGTFQSKPVLFWVILVLLLGFAAFVRFYDLKSDPPVAFSHGNEDLTTDGPSLTLHAKQAVFYDQWDLFGYQNWPAFKVSVVSGLSFMAFKFFGVSRSTANGTGSLLSITGIFLFLLALWDRRKSGLILLLALFLCTSYVLTIYGRVPLSENGLFFLAGLTFLVYSRWFHTTGGKITVGVLVTLCGLLGKSIGFLLGVGPLLFILLSGGTNRLRSTLLFIVPMLFTLGLFWLALYRTQGLSDFLWEHSAGVHGFPHGLESPKGFVEGLISYGRSGLHGYSVLVSLACALALLALVMNKTNLKELDKTALFMLGWIGSWVLILAPFNYLPLRYVVLLIVPMSVLGATFLDRLDGTVLGGSGKVHWWRSGVSLLIIWWLVYYVYVSWSTSLHQQDAFTAVWIVFPVALLLTAAMTLLLRSRNLVIAGLTARIIVFVFIAGTVILEGYQHYQWLSRIAYLLDYANNDVKTLVGSKAVIAGSYGPALTCDNENQSLPPFDTDDWANVCRILKTYPVTHLALSEAAWQDLVKLHPELQQAREVTRLWMRSVVVTVVRVSDLFGNQQAALYQLSDFEKLDMQILHQNMDSAGYYLNRHLLAHPYSRAGLAHQYYLAQTGQPWLARATCVKTLVDHYPTDFAVCQLAAIFYKGFHQASHDQMDLSVSRDYLERSVRYFPTNEEAIRRHYATYAVNRRVL